MNNENNNEVRKDEELKIDESQLSEEEIKETNKIHAPWGILIFCGVVLIAMIIIIVIISKL